LFIVTVAADLVFFSLSVYFTQSQPLPVMRVCIIYVYLFNVKSF